MSGDCPLKITDPRGVVVCLPRESTTSSDVFGHEVRFMIDDPSNGRRRTHFNLRVRYSSGQERLWENVRIMAPWYARLWKWLRELFRPMELPPDE